MVISHVIKFDHERINYPPFKGKKGVVSIMYLTNLNGHACPRLLLQSSKLGQSGDYCTLDWSLVYTSITSNY